MSTGPALSNSAIVATTASGSHLYKVDGYSATKAMPTGSHYKSCSFSVRNHSWFLAYLPKGDCPEHDDYISFFLVLDNTDAAPVMADFTMSLLDQAGKPVPSHTKRSRICHFAGPAAHWGFNRFVERETLEKSRYLKNDSFSIKCDVTVTTNIRAEREVAAGAAPVFVRVPPPDCLRHFRELLLSGKGVDVRFRVDGEDFAAHRCVLAARSPVFKAQLFGVMKEGTAAAQCVVEIDDMRPDVFKNMLNFIYTDSLLEPAEPVEPVTRLKEKIVMAQHLLVAADKYGIQRLKLICEDMLCRNMDVNTVVTTLALAEQHSCHKLKEVCIKFLKSPGVLDVGMVADFEHLTKSCPSLMKELVSNVALR